MTDDVITEIIKQAVLEAISIAGGTQAALAERSDLSQGAISKYILGKAKPTGLVAKRLALAVNNKIDKSRFAPHIYDGEPV